MKIITVNVLESYINAIEKLIGENGNYPSRSELVRCAVKEFLENEIEIAKNMELGITRILPKQHSLVEELEEPNLYEIVRIPYIIKDKEGNDVKEFKTYTTRRLE